MNSKTLKSVGVKFTSVFIALVVLSSVLAGGVMAADGDADETITVGSSGDYATVQEAVDAADSSVHTHIEITTADVTGSEIDVRLTNDDVYFQAATSGNALEINSLENPNDYTYSTSSDISFASTTEGSAESYEWTVGENSTYSTIQQAVDNATENDTIVIEEGTYETSVNLSTNNLTFDAASGNVTIDGSNTDSGVAFQNPENFEYTTSDSVEVIGMSAGGSGFGSEEVSNLLTSSIFGIPYWLIAIALIAVAYVYNERQN